MDKNNNNFNIFNEHAGHCDIIIKILTYLNDKEKIYFLSTCKYLNQFKIDIPFTRLVNLSKIINLQYYSNFTSIIAHGDDLKLLKRYNRSLPLITNKLIIKNFMGYVKTYTKNLSKLKYLTIENNCKVTIKKTTIPQSVTHLTWKSSQTLCENFFGENLVSLHVDNIPHQSTICIPKNLLYLTIGKKCSAKILFKFDCKLKD